LLLLLSQINYCFSVPVSVKQYDMIRDDNNMREVASLSSEELWSKHKKVMKKKKL